jgi:peptidoglycan/LPS O-acetylase OafA/YrhL
MRSAATSKVVSARHSKEKGMSAPAGGQDAERRLGIVLAFAFGCLFVAVVLALAFTGGSLDDRRFETLRIVLALAGGGVGGVIPGFLDLHMKAGTKWALRAGGGLAVFIVLYFWSPAHWVAPQPGSVSQHTGGVNSPAINGNGNNVTGGPVR